MTKLYEARAGDKRLTCCVCLKSFWATRSDAQTCSAKCRKRKLRRPAVRDRLKAIYTDLDGSFTALTMYAGNGDADSQTAERMVYSLMVKYAGYLSAAHTKDLAEQLRALI